MKYAVTLTITRNGKVVGASIASIFLNAETVTSAKNAIKFRLEDLNYGSDIKLELEKVTKIEG